MHRHAALHAHADRGDLVFGQGPPHPDPAATLDAVSGHIESTEHIDEDLLQPPDVRDDIDGLGEPDDRIADELSGAVPRDLAAAVNVDDGSSVGGTLVPCGARTGREDGLMLEQQERVGALARDDARVDLALQRPAVGVGDQVGGEPHRAHIEHVAPSRTVVVPRPTIRLDRVAR